MALRICFTYMFAYMFYALTALNHLLPCGLVGSDPKRGLIITELDQNMVGELYEMRLVLEGTAAALAARHATDVEIEVLRLSTAVEN